MINCATDLTDVNKRNLRTSYRKIFDDGACHYQGALKAISVYRKDSFNSTLVSPVELRRLVVEAEQTV